MAKNNPGDVLSCDWNPVIGCEKYSEGCRGCWYLEGIFPWQQRLGNIPDWVQPNTSHIFDNRMTEKNLKTKKGIIGVVQHGDLFWEGNSDAIIKRVLNIIEFSQAGRRVPTKHLLWTKRAERAIDFLDKHYSSFFVRPHELPDYLGLAISVENQRTVDERLPHISRLKGMIAVVAEPLLGEIDVSPYTNSISWMIVGSETGNNARPISLEWVRKVRDDVVPANIPFFIKQLGTSHKVQQRVLDGRTWDEFPEGWVK